MLCIGHASCFVKATPRSDHPIAAEAAARYKLPFKEPLRFAMCKVKRLEKMGYTVSAQFRDSEAYKVMRTSLCKSGLCRGEESVRELVGAVEEGAAIYRASDSSTVRLEDIHLVAVPLNADLQGSVWGVQPMVAIKPKTTVSKLKEVCNAKNARDVLHRVKKKAVNTACTYFTHVYTTSALGGDPR